MKERNIWTFFYGSYMNPKVLKEVDYTPAELQVACLPGFDISINPIANLIAAPGKSVYGVIATGTHTELARLYQHSQDVLGGQYLPEAVLVETPDGQWRPVLTYISPGLAAGNVANDYVDRILEPARKHGFPDWYITRLESFKH